MENIRTKLSGVAVAVSLALAAPMAAADMGVGADLNLNGSGGTIYLPIRLANFRVEPELSVNNYRDTYPSSPETYDSTWYRLGTGLYWNKSATNNVDVYMGARVGIEWSDYADTWNNNSWKDKTRGYYVAPTIGAEYMITKQFSLGMLASLVYNKYDEKYGYASWGYLEESSHNSLYTETKLVVRMYF